MFKNRVTKKETLHSPLVLRPVLLAAALLVAPVYVSAEAVDWDGVEGNEVTLFYPGQASWEWALTQSDHSGNERFRQGRNCSYCHKGEEGDIGKLIVAGEKLEPTPIDGKPGSVKLDVKMVNDGERLHVRLAWPDTGYKPVEPMDEDNALRVTMMLDNGGVGEATRASCWGTCHDDANRMASANGEERVKYLSASRNKMSRSGGGDNVKADDEIAKLLAGNHFMEYWQARVGVDGEAKSVHGYILDERHETFDSKVDVDVSREGDNWVAVLSRDLKASGTGYKTLGEADELMVGFALHDGHATGRAHYVSLDYSASLNGGDADLQASKR
ncbi:ethylbenzene dehydrogenase-related protein [Thiohalomonas denitrificans]|uniref:Ethylbenzene dehydrogenase n=1 Tax=Thiohalomonas denitrificans TaxID=415747 RepID=A0A1G5QX90_9GAMM|nr:ethylbenzene dehydrogenase-related protein [Thiohalomonas denitrificans]SCZ65679.1 Ethylbenzene dehydrogenase [Thiohalomonas denitrificans]